MLLLNQTPTDYKYWFSFLFFVYSDQKKKKKTLEEN